MLESLPVQKKIKMPVRQFLSNTVSASTSILYIYFQGVGLRNVLNKHVWVRRRVLFAFQGICMIIGGLRHSEQRFNSRSAGVSCALLFISIGGMYLKISTRRRLQKQFRLPHENMWIACMCHNQKTNVYDCDSFISLFLLVSNTRSRCRPL